MYAVIRTGGKQYRVAPDDVIEIEKVAGEAGEIVQFGEVLMLGGDKPQVGTPLIDGASVAGQVIEQKRGEKVIVFKKKRRKNYRRKRGHRQHLTAVRITEILTGGKKPSKTAAAKPAPAKKEEKAEAKKPAAAEKKAQAKPAAKKAEPKKAEAKAKAPAKKPPAKKPAAKKAASKAKKD
jgi:large subunit ribosomal protein L21